LKNLLDQNEDLYKSLNDCKIQRKDSNTQYGYSIEPRLFFNNLGLGLFIGRQFLSKAKYSVYNSDNSFINESYQLHAITLGLNLYYKFKPFHNNRYWIIIGTGGSYYKASYDYSYCHKTTETTTTEKDSTKDNFFGFHTKGEIHFSINQNNDSLFIGIEGVKSSKMSIKDTYNGMEIEVLKLYFTGITVYAGLSFNIF